MFDVIYPTILAMIGALLCALLVHEMRNEDREIEFLILVGVLAVIFLGGASYGLAHLYTLTA